MICPALLHRLAPVLLLGSVAAADLTVFRGAAAGVGSVRVVDEAGLAVPSEPATLQDIVLLPIDFAGRTQLERFLPGRPRLVEDVPGASRLKLPAGQGSLYRYRRDAAVGVIFGFFTVAPDGAARSVLEKRGSGPAQAVDPFVSRVAIDPAGQALLVATTAAAGGDLLEVDLATGTSTLRTATLTPRTFSPGGLGLRPTWGVAVTDEGVYRFPRTPAAQVEAVAFPAPAPVWFGGEVVFSGDELHAGTIAGASPTEAFPWVVEPSGQARRVGTVARPVQRAGFLPDDAAGPFLALSHDAELCMFRTEPFGTQVAREAFVGRTAPAAPEPEQFTGNGEFLDTLDEIGVAGFVQVPTGGEVLVVGVGARNDLANGGIEQMDLFRIELPAAGPISFTNLSATSGDTNVPFLVKGQIDPEDGLFRVPGTDTFAYHDGAIGYVATVSVSSTTGEKVLLPIVKSLENAELAGNDLLFFVRRDTDQREHQLLRISPAAGGTLQLLATTPDGTQITLAGRDDGSFGAQVRFGLDAWLFHVNAANGASLLTSFPVALQPTLGFSPQGHLVSSGGLAGIFQGTIAWTPGAFLAVSSYGPLAPDTELFLPGL